MRAERILFRGGSEIFFFNLGEDWNQFFPKIIIVFYKIPKILGRIDPPILLGSALTVKIHGPPLALDQYTYTNTYIFYLA